LLALLSIFFGAGFTLATAYALGVVLLRTTPAPPEIALALGAVAESFLVFLCLLLNIGHWAVFLGMGLAALAALARFRRLPLAEPARAPLGKFWAAAGAIFAMYGLWYFVNALAPETMADGITYHLGLPYEYVRLGGFPDRIAFYDLVPQGMEMLYTVAFAFGRHSAAKLVEFSFFLATLPLIFRIGRRMGAGDLASLVAAVFYFSAPVVGLTGSSSYNDAAGVFFMLAAFYLLLVWRDMTGARYLLPAGLLLLRHQAAGNTGCRRCRALRAGRAQPEGRRTGGRIGVPGYGAVARSQYRAHRQSSRAADEQPVPEPGFSHRCGTGTFGRPALPGW
jgi:hypothetical protein